MNKIPFWSVQRNKQVIFITIGEALQIVVRASPILSFSLCCPNTIGAVIRTSPKGEAQRIKKKSVKTSNWRCEFTVLLAYWRGRGAPLRL